MASISVRYSRKVTGSPADFSSLKKVTNIADVPMQAAARDNAFYTRHGGASMKQVRRTISLCVKQLSREFPELTTAPRRSSLTAAILGQGGVGWPLHQSTR